MLKKIKLRPGLFRVAFAKKLGLPGVGLLRARQAVPFLPGRDVIDHVAKEGRSSTSFLTLYSGYQYFRHTVRGDQQGLIAYVDTPTAWVGASDPAAPPEIQNEVLLEFFAQAKKAGKAALILPVSRALAERARQDGNFVVQVGLEPWFAIDLPGATLRPNLAKRLQARGAIVERFDPFRLSTVQNQELDALTESWLESRASVPLGFLNRVEPWLYVRQKRYFRVLYHSQLMGYLAAVPVPARKSWYLVDLIRSPDAPLGTVELLISEAIEHLAKEGAKEVTLGMSPLAPVEATEFAHHRRIYGALSFIFDRFDGLYGFRSLYEFKKKFRPTRWEPHFLIASPSFNLRVSYGLLRAIYPKGLIATTAALLHRKAMRFQFTGIYSRVLSDKFVPRRAPVSISEYLIRCRIVFAIAATNAMFFLAAADPSGDRIRPKMGSRYGYSLDRLISGGFSHNNAIALLLSSFLHWNLEQLLFNLTTLLIFCGFLEVVGGSALTACCYFFGILFSNPLTSLALYPWVWLANRVHPGCLEAFSKSIDIGCSLGVFSCLGALVGFLKKPKATLFLLVIAIVITSIVDKNILDLNHVAALGIGLLFGRYYVPQT